MVRKMISALTAVVLLLAVCGCRAEAPPIVTADPYAGMVEVDSGYGTRMWVQCLENVPSSPLDATEFRRRGDRVEYTGDAMTVRQGIDVSEHQETIDWTAVAADGIEFAMIRMGYRGYSEGGLFEDRQFRNNVNGALENGIQVGVYFFSQATSCEEALEEAELLLEALKAWPVDAVTLPVVFDWEPIGTEEARTADVDGELLTDLAVAFCDRVRTAGYMPGVYAFRYLAYFTYDLSELDDCTLWIGAVGDSPDFYYAHEIWQYSDTGTVKGIEGAVDRDLLFCFDEKPGRAAEGNDAAVSETAER